MPHQIIPLIPHTTQLDTIRLTIRPFNILPSDLLQTFSVHQMDLGDHFAINQLGDIPLFVNEGSSADKLKAIRSSDYLSFCYSQLAQPKENLCIFGHNLAKQDLHLVQALQQADLKTLAISIYPHNPLFIAQQKQHYTALFAEQKVELRFFDALSHPLGDPALRVAITPPQ